STLAGPELAGLPGRIYAKQLREASTEGLRPFWQWLGHDDPEDTRLVPGRADRREFVFSAEPALVRVRLIYRRVWPGIAASRAWPKNEIVVAEQTFTLGTPEQGR